MKFFNLTAALSFFLALSLFVGGSIEGNRRLASSDEFVALESVPELSTDDSIIEDADDALTNQFPVIQNGALVASGNEIHRATAYIHLVRDSGRPTACSGTYLTPELILTAAHCIVGMRHISVRYGTQPGNPSKFDGAFEIKEKIVHEGYARNPEVYDIALIKVPKAVPNALPVALPKASASLKDGTGLLIAGWGYNENKRVGLRTGNTEYNSPGGLNASHPGVFSHEINRNQLLCGGDSGGPSYVREKGKLVVVGVASRGNGCGNKGFFTPNLSYSIYVANYIGWIKSSAKKLKATIEI